MLIGLDKRTLQAALSACSEGFRAATLASRFPRGYIPDDRSNGRTEGRKFYRLDST